MYTRTVFSALGDWGLQTMTQQRVLQALKEIQCRLDFCVLLGDNFYPDGVASVDDPRWASILAAFPPHLRLYALLGNHDYHLNPRAQMDYHLHSWKMPHYFYDRVENHVHMLFLDTAILAPAFTTNLFQQCSVSPARIQAFQQHAKTMGIEQLRWIEHRLSTMDAPWKIVFGHYPLVSNGPHDVSLELYGTLFPLLQRYGVDLYMAGHDHNAQVIQHQSLLCVVSGAISMIAPPSRHMPGTLFVSTQPGQFVCSVDDKTLDLKYVDAQLHVRYSLSKTQPVY
jgi:acid phosphatase